jgi:hypothetical protein
VCKLCVPEDAVAGLVDFPGAQNGNVTGQGRLHEKRLSVKLSRFPWPPSFEDLARGVETDRDLPLLEQGVCVWLKELISVMLTPLSNTILV